MVDLFGADKGNISLPPRLQSPEVVDGQPDNLKQVMILNMQKAFYHVRITDIEKRIQSLQSRNTELEELCGVKKLLHSQTDVETADQITQLNRQIFGEVEKITDYQKRIQAVRKWMEEEKQTHLDKVEAANKKYTKTRLSITSEIKVLNAKINTLEEYKASKTDLRNKLIAGNNLIAQRDEEVKQRCEQNDRKFKIGREKLKKEMYARLQGLAGTFQMEVAASVAKPIHRLMRENIFVKNELINIVRESVPKKETIKQNKEADDQIILETAITKKNTVQHLIASNIQRYLLATVEEQHARVKDGVDKLKQFEYKGKIQSVEVTYGSAQIQANEALQYISKLETCLHRQHTQLEFMNYLRDRSRTEIQRCTDVLYDAKYAVVCALGMTDTGKDLLEMEDKQLMSYLLDILCNGDTQRWKNRTPSLATVPPSEEVYKIGDLGFDVSNIESVHSRETMIQKKLSKPSTLKILAGLDIRLSTGMSVMDMKESDNLTAEKTDKIIRESSISLGPQEEELEQKSADLEADDEEEPEMDEEEEVNGKIEIEEKMTKNESGKQDEVDIDDSIKKKDETDKSAMIITENNASSPEENGTQE